MKLYIVVKLISSAFQIYIETTFSEFISSCFFFNLNGQITYKKHCFSCISAKKNSYFCLKTVLDTDEQNVSGSSNAMHLMHYFNFLFQ